MKLPVVEPGMQVQYRPSDEEIDKCYEFGRNFAREVREYHKKFQ